MLAAGEDRSRASNDGYDDSPSSHYSWDSTVNNRDQPAVGHVIVLWDKKQLLGVSVIEKIEHGTGVKDTYRCAKCGSSKVETRATMEPRIKCYAEGCKATFDRLEPEVVPVRTFRTKHDQDWMDLYGKLTGAQLRSLCLKPKSMNSIRELDYDRFVAALGDTPTPTTLTRIDAAASVASGHRQAYVRVRVGQGPFRGGLIDTYGHVCAFTGPTPPEALEAAHLYSYAKVGEHHEDGGLLMRRDIHRLFDEGLIAVHPDTLRIDVHPNIAGYEEYARLHDKPLRLEPTSATCQWLRRHWDQARATSTAAA